MIKLKDKVLILPKIISLTNNGNISKDCLTTLLSFDPDLDIIRFYTPTSLVCRRSNEVCVCRIRVLTKGLKKLFSTRYPIVILKYRNFIYERDMKNMICHGLSESGSMKYRPELLRY